MAYKKLGEKPLVFLDVETSGLDPAVHEILEFAGIKNNGSLVLKIKPRRIHNASPKALEVNGYNGAEWSDAADFREAAKLIFEFLRDSVLVAHNARFDVDFVSALLREAGIQERVDYHIVDTIGLAYVFLVPNGLESLALAPVCKFLGVEPEPRMHRALAGANSCKKVYEQLASRIPY